MMKKSLLVLLLIVFCSASPLSAQARAATRPPVGLPLMPGKQARVTCGFRDKNYPSHYGVDFSIPEKTEIIATMKGQVAYSGYDKLYGNLIIIENGGYQTWYAHNAFNLTRQGDSVDKGEIIALSGNTGSSSNPHLHYGIQYAGQWLDPLKFSGGANVTSVGCRQGEK